MEEYSDGIICYRYGSHFRRNTLSHMAVVPPLLSTWPCAVPDGRQGLIRRVCLRDVNLGVGGPAEGTKRTRRGSAKDPRVLVRRSVRKRANKCSSVG